MDLDTEEGLQELASQLGNPTGDLGIIVAERMHANNLQMTRKTVESLHLKDTDIVLEIGPGSATHVLEIVQNHKNITYYGLDISNLMVEEAKKINSESFRESKTSFQLYDGKNLPFPEEFFDKIMTVNTIYFWKEPEKFLKEIKRVMRPNAIFSICFGDKDFMEQLPFTRYGFHLYNTAELKNICGKTGFIEVHTINSFDTVATGKDTFMERPFTILTVSKK